MILPASEAFGMQQRVDEVDAEHDDDGEGDQGIPHGAPPSDSIAEESVGAEEREPARAQREENEIKHGTSSEARFAPEFALPGIKYRSGKGRAGVRVK